VGRQEQADDKTTQQAGNADETKQRSELRTHNSPL
jgi:hypothetical protein